MKIVTVFSGLIRGFMILFAGGCVLSALHTGDYSLFLGVPVSFAVFFMAGTMKG